MSITTISFHSSQAPPLPIHRFSVEEYHRLGELGLLTPENRVELLEGWIVEKMNQRPAHGYVVGVLTQWLPNHLADGWIARCQLPITLEASERFARGNTLLKNLGDGSFGDVSEMAAVTIGRWLGDPTSST